MIVKEKVKEEVKQGYNFDNLTPFILLDKVVYKPNDIIFIKILFYNKIIYKEAIMSNAKHVNFTITNSLNISIC